MCAQRRLRSAWASAQSDQSLCPHEESLGPELHIQHTAKTDQTGHMPFCRFCRALAQLFSLMDSVVQVTSEFNKFYIEWTSTITLWTGLFLIAGCLFSFYYYYVYRNSCN